MSFRNSVPAGGDFCRLLITFAKSLEPDQALQVVGPGLELNCVTLMVFLKEFSEKVDFEKNQRDDIKSMKTYPACKEFKKKRA